MKNLITRTLTGVIFVAVVVGGIWLHPWLFLCVFGLVTGGLLWEFQALANPGATGLFKRLAASLGGVYLFAATFVYANGWMGGGVFLPYLLFLMYTLIAELYSRSPRPVNDWASALFAQAYCAGSFSLLNFIAFVPAGKEGGGDFTPLFTLAVFVFVWVNDTGAYLVGSTFGKRRLFERISPKKSWEGFGGGMLATLLSSQLFAWLCPEVSRYDWLALSGCIVLFATWGDLIESLLKRSAGVKDSGDILPGHGGMLDRFDSILLAIPAAYIYIEWFIRN
ncbi:MAG: phosphatidate cytidylyltransferase [Tannerellaceae bacterium]|jgi:phosphatidate cytidylyltransferase|nr:phosphatidate cytidylyltransferase [Tannerellaceae bacterium]